MLLSSSNRKYPPFPLLSYFPWLCAWDVCYIIFCHLLHTRSGKTGNLFSLSLCSLLWVQIFGYVLACRSYSFVCTVHHLITIIVQTYLKALNLLNACQIYFVECVSKIKHILSVIHYTIFRVRSWNNGVRCMSFYILMNQSLSNRCALVFINSMYVFCNWYFARTIFITMIDLHLTKLCLRTQLTIVAMMWVQGRHSLGSILLWFVKPILGLYPANERGATL